MPYFEYRGIHYRVVHHSDIGVYTYLVKDNSGVWHQEDKKSQRAAIQAAERKIRELY